MAGISFDIGESIVKTGVVRASGSNRGVDGGNTLEEVGIVDGFTLDALREEIVQGALGFSYSVNPNSLAMSKDTTVSEVIDVLRAQRIPVITVIEVVARNVQQRDPQNPQALTILIA